jgi:hypothetical protein
VADAIGSHHIGKAFHRAETHAQIKRDRGWFSEAVFCLT